MNIELWNSNINIKLSWSSQKSIKLLNIEQFMLKRLYKLTNIFNTQIAFVTQTTQI